MKISYVPEVDVLSIIFRLVQSRNIRPRVIMVKKIKKKSHKGKTKGSASGPKSQPPSPTQTEVPEHFMTEQYNRLVRKIMSRHEFQSMEEAKAFLQEHVVRKTIDEIKAELGHDPEEEAQELAFMAMESFDYEEVSELVKKALDLDPYCIDARAMEATLKSKSDAELMDKLDKILEVARELIGEEFFREHSGDFWRVIETRPYMRVKEALIRMLIEHGEKEKAIGHCEAMLELNPDDNQGIREILLGLYFETDNLEGTKRLIERYENDIMSTFTWAKVLERYLSGDLKSAQKALKEAQKTNPHVKDLLTGEEPPPEEYPEYYSPGDITEAYVCYRHLAPAWQKHPEAIEWLKSIR